MTMGHSLPSVELQRFQQVVARSVEARSHFDVFTWLQGEMQQYLPHDIMIASWGDFSNGTIQYDIISALDGVRSLSTDQQVIKPLLLDLFKRWIESGSKPVAAIAGYDGFAIEASERTTALGDAMRTMQYAMAHGISDKRDSYDCLYVTLRVKECFNESEHEVMTLALPYIDIALRQVELLPHQGQASAVISTPLIYDLLQSRGLSGREVEILQWVALGKTNPEIGKILKISEFTVKNHMQRIFKKMDVSNRAQAVGRFKAMVSDG